MLIQIVLQTFSLDSSNRATNTRVSINAGNPDTNKLVLPGSFQLLAQLVRLCHRLLADKALADIGGWLLIHQRTPGQ
jgi:hypothetical protein